jgi:hypothetical protein
MLLSNSQGIFIGFLSNSLKLPKVLITRISVLSKVPFTNRKNYLRVLLYYQKETFIPGSLLE